MTLKAALIIALALVVVVGGLLLLRSSARTGMPSDEVLKRAGERARQQQAEEREQDLS
jgi:hypothetical protein